MLTYVTYHLIYIKYINVKSHQNEPKIIHLTCQLVDILFELQTNHQQIAENIIVRTLTSFVITNNLVPSEFANISTGLFKHIKIKIYKGLCHKRYPR